MASIAVTRKQKADLDTLVGRIKAEHAATLTAVRSSVEHAITCGQLLLEAKGKLKHGKWLPWLVKIGIPARSAQTYMALAEYATNTQRVAHLEQLPLRRAVLHIRKEQAEEKRAYDREETQRRYQEETQRRYQEAQRREEDRQEDGSPQEPEPSEPEFEPRIEPSAESATKEKPPVEVMEARQEEARILEQESRETMAGFAGKEDHLPPPQAEQPLVRDFVRALVLDVLDGKSVLSAKLQAHLDQVTSALGIDRGALYGEMLAQRYTTKPTKAVKKKVVKRNKAPAG